MCTSASKIFSRFLVCLAASLLRGAPLPCRVLCASQLKPAAVVAQQCKGSCAWQLMKKWLQGLANTAWACARLGVHTGDLLDAIATESASRLDTFTTQGVSNLCWAFAKLGHRPPGRFLNAADAHIQANFNKYSSQGVSLVLFGLAMQGHRSPILLDLVSREIESCGLQFSPHDLAAAMAAFAMMKYNNKRTIACVLQQCIDNLKQFESEPQLLCSIMWAVAQLRLRDSVCASCPSDVVLLLTLHVSHRLAAPVQPQVWYP
jgi:hypothetical protein